MEQDAEGWKRGLMSGSPAFLQVREVTVSGSNLLGSTPLAPLTCGNVGQRGFLCADVSARGRDKGAATVSAASRGCRRHVGGACPGAWLAAGGAVRGRAADRGAEVHSSCGRGGERRQNRRPPKPAVPTAWIRRLTGVTYVTQGWSWLGGPPRVTISAHPPCPKTFPGQRIGALYPSIRTGEIEFMVGTAQVPSAGNQLNAAAVVGGSEDIARGIYRRAMRGSTFHA